MSGRLEAMKGGETPIIVFDAQCVLCSANAQFVLKHDRRGHFRLATQQSEAGIALYRHFGIDPDDPETLIVVSGDRAERYSDAVFAIARGLGWPWRAACAFRVVPRFIRDPFYRLVARNRYRLFGKLEACWAPTAEQRGRLL